MGWWFGRILTFEVIADVEPPAVSSVLEDASAGAIACEADQPVVGYAAYGASIEAAVQPLVDCFGLKLFDDGLAVRSPLGAPPPLVSDDLLGNSADGKREAPIKRDQLPASGMPASLRLSYYDPARDYQTGEARASAADENANEQQQELPAVVTAAVAKSLAQQMLARAWTTRDRLTLRLQPAFLDLEPGAEIQLGIHPGLWVVDTCTVDGFVVVVDALPAWTPAVSLAAEAGRIVANADIKEGDLTLALFDLPDVLGQSLSQPTLLLAASTSGSGWKPKLVELSFGGQTIATATARSKSVLGTSVNVLGPGEISLIDEINSVAVRLSDGDQWLTSCDDEALIAGHNLAVLGSELLQFGEATRLADGSWQLSRLLRGRAGTESAIDGHQTGETFCLIQGGEIRPISLPQWIIGSDVTVTEVSGAAVSVTCTGESLRPPSPVNVSAELQPDGSMSVNWTRRSRSGWAWTDQVDAPLAEGREQYQVTIAGSAGTLELVADQPNLSVGSDQLAMAGDGAATVEVCQIGDWALSKPARLAITI